MEGTNWYTLSRLPSTRYLSGLFAGCSYIDTLFQLAVDPKYDPIKGNVHASPSILFSYIHTYVQTNDSFPILKDKKNLATRSLAICSHHPQLPVSLQIRPKFRHVRQIPTKNFGSITRCLVGNEASQNMHAQLKSLHSHAGLLFSSASWCLHLSHAWNQLQTSTLQIVYSKKRKHKLLATPLRRFQTTLVLFCVAFSCPTTPSDQVIC